jgi:hypothetical protein
MAEDVTLRWGSTGFERVNQEFDMLQRRSDEIRSWGEKVAGGFKRMEEATQYWFRQHKESIGQGITILGDLGNTAIKVSAAFLGLGTVIAGTAAAVVGEFGKAVIKATESNRQLEMSLYGATNSWDAVAKVEKFADQYAREYAVGSEQTLKAMRELAFIPALRPIIAKGDVEEMRNYMDLARALVLIRPEAGIQGAETALRQAFMGRWRGLQQYGIRPEEVAALQGVSVKTLEHKPEVALAGLEKWKEQTVGADALAQSLKTVSAQVTMMRSTWHEWLETIGKTGIYDKVVGYMEKLRISFSQFMESSNMRKWTTEINRALEGVADTIANIFTKGINWNDVSSFSGLWEAVKKVASNLWDSVKEPLAEGLQKALNFAVEAVMPVIEEVFVPVGMAIGGAVVKGSKEAMEKHPLETMGTAAATGAISGPGGFWGKVISAVGLMELSALPTQIGTIKSLWSGYADFMEGIGSRVEAAIGRMLGRKEVPFIPPPFPTAEEHGQAERAAAWREKLMPEEHGQAERAAAFAALPTPPRTPLYETPAEKEYTRHKLWEHMAATMAKAPVGPQEPTGASYLFATGKIKEPEYFQRRKMEEFQEERMTRLGKIAEMPEAEPATKSKIFQEMFGVAAGKGDFSKAQEYMNKSIDSMKESMKTQAELLKEQKENAKATADNTNKTVSVLEKTLCVLESIDSKSGNKETGTGTAQEKGTQIPDELLQVVSDPWTQGW